MKQALSKRQGNDSSFILSELGYFRCFCFRFSLIFVTNFIEGLKNVFCEVSNKNFGEFGNKTVTKLSNHVQSRLHAFSLRTRRLNIIFTCLMSKSTSWTLLNINVLWLDL